MAQKAKEVFMAMHPFQKDPAEGSIFDEMQEDEGWLYIFSQIF